MTFISSHLSMETRVNERRYEEHIVEGCHLKLKDLKNVAQDLKNWYLSNRLPLPPFPRPEFHVSFLKHDTNQAGLCGIRRKKGFMNPGGGSLLWWSLVVGPEEMASAERRLLEDTYPDRTEEQARAQRSFLEKFASSPAFQRSSRLGSYRITIPLEEVLRAYSEQVLNFDENRLREQLTFCEKGHPVINRPSSFNDFTKAEKFVKRLWPEYLSPLRRAEDRHEGFHET